MKRLPMVFAVALAACLLSSHVQAQESMERVLLKNAPKLIKHFKDNGYKNVGVLKFLVSRDGKSLTDNVGSLNSLAAQRLELALILANDPRDPVGIIENASDVARNIAGANHLNAAGRVKLFAGE